jgi:RNA polymerase sigma factor (sigma-70 family)
MIKNKTDNELVLDIKNNSNEALIELASRHNKLFYSTCSKFARTNNNFNYDDAISDIYLIVYETAKSFNPQKNIKFSTWLGYHSRFYCLNKLKNAHKLVFEDNNTIDIINNNNNRVFEPKNMDNSDYIMDLIGQMKDQRVKKIFKLRFLSGQKKMSWKEIGKKLNISTTHAINIFIKSKKFLLNRIKSKDLSDKI